MAFFGKFIYFYNLFPQSATLPLYLFICFFICQPTFFILLFLALDIFSRSFSLNFARTLGRAVDKLLNGSKVNSHGQFIFGEQSLSLFRGNTKFKTKPRV